MKKFVNSVNNLTIQAFLFFVYFIAVGLAWFVYHAQNMITNNIGKKKINIYNQSKAYFLSPY
jgi:hypothetical protein